MAPALQGKRLTSRTGLDISKEKYPVKRAVIGIVETKTQAQAVIELLEQSGIGRNDISVLLPDQHGSRDFAHERHTKSPEGAIAGVGAGGVIGGAIGLLAGIGVIAIPGIGPFIAAGPLMAALSAAAVGAGVGGIAGALVGMGIPEIEAKAYEGKVRGGNVLVAVHVESREAEAAAKDILQRTGAHDIDRTGEAPISKQARLR